MERLRAIYFVFDGDYVELSKSNRWIYGEGREPLRVIDRRSGRRIPRLRILDDEGRPLALRDIALVPGPGANKQTRATHGAT